MHMCSLYMHMCVTVQHLFQWLSARCYCCVLYILQGLRNDLKDAMDKLDQEYLTQIAMQQVCYHVFEKAVQLLASTHPTIKVLSLTSIIIISYYLISPLKETTGIYMYFQFRGPSFMQTK